MAAELYWMREGLRTNYHVILDLRNECAVAALALHQWSLYQSNNKVYTQLFREISAHDAAERELEDRGRGAAHPVAAAVAAGLLSALLPPRAELPVCHD